MCPCENMAYYMEHLFGPAFECRCLINRRYIQDSCGHTALRARKWSGFICKRPSEDTTLSARSTEERRRIRRRRMPNRDFF